MASGCVSDIRDIYEALIAMVLLSLIIHPIEVEKGAKIYGKRIGIVIKPTLHEMNFVCN